MFSNIFTFVIVAALATDVLGLALGTVCYPDGITGSADCTSFIANFCGSVSPLSVPGGENVGRCYVGNGHRCDFIAFNTGTTAAQPTSADCQSVLNGVVNTCSTGGIGQTASAAFSYTVDPNVGACGDQVTGGS